MALIPLDDPQPQIKPSATLVPLDDDIEVLPHLRSLMANPSGVQQLNKTSPQEGLFSHILGAFNRGTGEQAKNIRAGGEFVRSGEPMVHVDPRLVGAAAPLLSLLPKDISQAAMEGGADLASGLTTPTALGAIAAAPMAPTLAALGFGAMGAQGVGESFGKASVDIPQGNRPEATKDVLSGLASLVQMLAPFGISSKVHSDIEAKNAIPPRIEQRSDAGIIAQFQPSPKDRLSTPEALRRSNEMQIEQPTSNNPQVVPSQRLPRIFQLEAKDLAERVMQGNIRRQELRQGGRLEESGQTFSGFEGEYPKSAENIIANRAGPEEPTVDVKAAPLSGLLFTVAEKLRTKDFVGAIDELQKQPAEVSRRVVDKLLDVKKEPVPISAGERLVFNELWEKTYNEKIANEKAVKPGNTVPVSPADVGRLPASGVGESQSPVVAEATPKEKVAGDDAPAVAAPSKGLDIQLGTKEAGFTRLPFADSIDQLRRGLVTSFKNKGETDKVSAYYDAIHNAAAIVGQKAANSLRLDVSNNKDLDLLAPIIESGGNLQKLQADAALVQGSTKATPQMKKVYADAVSQFQRLSPFVQKAQSLHDLQLAHEVASGIETHAVENYVAHRYDMDTVSPGKPVVLSATGGKSNSAFFRKERVFDTYAKAIAAGYEPKTLNAADLIQHRITAGQNLINQRLFVEQLRNEKSPVTGGNLITDLSPKGTAPKGYRIVEPFPGQRVAVSEDFAPLISALTGESHVPTILNKTEGLIKHGMLFFDTFHASRILQNEAALSPTLGYRKGVALLEYKVSDLNKAVHQKQITPEMAAWARKNSPIVREGISNGLNVGRISDALYKDVTSSIPIVGKAVSGANKFIFDKLTRGAMTEAYIWAFDKNQKLYTGKSRQEIARLTAKEINTYFGNLGSQGFFKSKTWQDMARLTFLAPQWVESMGRKEVSAIGQAVRGNIRGTLARGVGTGLLGYVAATQIMNYFTTGHSTLNNPEGHKMDAYVPDFIEHGPGYWLSPLAVPMEITHQLIRYADKEGALGAISHTVKNKLSPVMQSARTVLTQRNFFNQPINGNVVKQVALNLLPEPIPLKGMTGGMVGEKQKQIMASLGVKTENRKDSITEQANLVGKTVEQLSPSERLAMKNKVKPGANALTPEAKYSATEKRARDELTLERNVLEGLSKENQAFLEKHKLTLPEEYNHKSIESRYANTYTPREKDFLQDAMVRQYDKAIARLSQQGGWDVITPMAKEARLKRVLKGAFTLAEVDLMKARKDGSLEKPMKRNDFSIRNGKK